MNECFSVYLLLSFYFIIHINTTTLSGSELLDYWTLRPLGRSHCKDTHPKHTPVVEGEGELVVRQGSTAKV